MIDNAERREKHASAVDWEALDRWRAVGGVRIEDNILVTAEGEPHNLTEGIAK